MVRSVPPPSGTCRLSTPLHAAARPHAIRSLNLPPREAVTALFDKATEARTGVAGGGFHGGGVYVLPEPGAVPPPGALGPLLTGVSPGWSKFGVPIPVGPSKPATPEQK